MADDAPAPLEAVEAHLRRLPPEQLLAGLAHRLRHAEETVAALRGLVPKAFAEGFARRAPDAGEPWLIDWLTSQAKRELEALVPRPAHTDESPTEGPPAPTETEP
jgi:hypothetical protein